MELNTDPCACKASVLLAEPSRTPHQYLDARGPSVHRQHTSPPVSPALTEDLLCVIKGTWELQSCHSSDGGKDKATQLRSTGLSDGVRAVCKSTGFQSWVHCNKGLLELSAVGITPTEC